MEPVLGQTESLSRGNLNVIQTVLFTDGLKRAVQTKKDAAVSPQAGTAPTHVMTVSGRVIPEAR